eukprot:6477338-Amphidinium_carterae.1
MHKAMPGVPVYEYEVDDMPLMALAYSRRWSVTEIVAVRQSYSAVMAGSICREQWIGNRVTPVSGGIEGAA